VRVVVRVNGVAKRTLAPKEGRFRALVALPPRDVRVRVVAIDRFGNRAGRSVAPVYGLPRAATPTGHGPSREDRALARRLRALAREHPGIAAAYVQDLRTRVGAAWNARARFPAASTVKLAIAIEVLRTLRGEPARGSSLHGLLRRMLAIRIDSHDQPKATLRACDVSGHLIDDEVRSADERLTRQTDPLIVEHPETFELVRVDDVDVVHGYQAVSSETG
jgi:hypothetical protein